MAFKTNRNPLTKSLNKDRNPKKRPCIGVELYLALFVAHILACHLLPSACMLITVLRPVV